jgi:hypothetical protein
MRVTWPRVDSSAIRQQTIRPPEAKPRKGLDVSGRGLALAAVAVVVAGLVAIGSLISGANPAPPVGCSASNVDYYLDAETGAIDVDKMSRLEWVPVSAADSAEIVGCVPQALADPTNDDNRALMEFGEGDPNVPLPIFRPDGSLFGYFVVYKGSVPLDDAIANGDVPERLVADPPKVTDFEPDFTPHSD